MDALVRRRNALLFRIPLVTAGVVALFWGMWWFATGDVPMVDSVMISKETVYHLPFAVSRWLDIPSAAVFAALVVMVWHSALVIGNDLADFSAGIVFALSAVFVFACAVLGAITFAIPVLTIGTGIVVVVGIAVGKEEYKRGIMARTLFSGAVALGVGIGSAVRFGGVVGLGVTVAMALAYTVLSTIVFSAAYGAKKLVQNRRALGRGALDWLLARDVVGGNSQ